MQTVRNWIDFMTTTISTMIAIGYIIYLTTFQDSLDYNPMVKKVR